MLLKGRKEFDKELNRWYTTDDFLRLQEEWKEIIELVMMLANNYITMTLTEYAALPPALKTYITVAHNELNARDETN